MATFVTPKKNTAFEFYVGLISQANTKIMQVSPTMAAGDVKVSTDNGASSNITTLPVIGTNTRLLKVNLSASEMNGDNVSISFSDAAGAEWCDLVVNIQTSAQQVDDLASAAALAVVDGIVDDILVDTGTTLQGELDGIQVDTEDIQTRLPAALSAGGNIKADTLSLGGVVQSLTDLKDFADDGYDPATNKVQGVVLADTVTTYTGNTPQTGDNFARLGAPAGASVSADVAAVKADTAAVKAKTDNLPSDPADQSLVIAATDAVMSRLGAPAGASVSADIAAIEDQTDEIGAAGAGLTALASAANLATVSTNVSTLLTRIPAALFAGITSMAEWLGLIAGKQTGNATARTELRATGVGSGTYDETTDAQEAIRDGIGAAGAGLTALGDARIANLDATVSSRATPAQVNTEADLALSDVGLTSTVTGRIDAAVTTRASQTSMDLAKAVVDAITLKTVNLPSDPADQSLVIAATDALAALINALSIPNVGAIATAIGTRVLEPAAGVNPALTVDLAQRLAAAGSAGKLTGPAAGVAGTVRLRDVGDSTDLVTGTVDANAQRTAIVVDP